MYRRTAIIALAALAFSGPVAAQETQQFGPYGAVTYEELFVERSNPDESLETFVLRVGLTMRAWSDKTGYEACGVLATDGSVYGIVVGTNHSRIACINTNRFMPDGMRSMRLTFHSHGGPGKFKPNTSDMKLMGHLFAGRNGRLQTVHGQLPDVFSDADHDSGPGYLAGTNGQVWYQGGRGTQPTLVTVNHIAKE